MWPRIDPNFLYNRFKIILKPAEIVCHIVTKMGNWFGSM